MRIDNIPSVGSSVNTSGHFEPTRRYSRARGAQVSAAVTMENENENTVSLEQARIKQREKIEKEWVIAHEVDSRGRVKPPSLEYIFGSQISSGKLGKWACQSTEASGAIIHKWDGTYWKAINTDVGIGVASTWLKNNAKHAVSQKRAASCWDHAEVDLRTLNPLPVQSDKRAIVPCADFYIEVLPTGFQALKPDPALGMTHAVRIKCGASGHRPYSTTALPKTSKFAQFLERALPDPEVRALVQEQCGMTLLPGNYSKAAWWYGAAGSGKSTLAELVEALHRQSVRLSLEALGDRFSLEPLVGASLILVDEVECERWAEGRFKTLVSGNGIGIDRKNEKALASYHSKAKWLITSNSAPFVRDKSDGVWRRLTVVQWNVVIPESERIPDFQKTILETEGKLVLDWMLEGARRVVARGRALSDHELPEAAIAAKKRARNGSDSVRAWADEMRVVSEPGHWVQLTEIYAGYEAWCGLQGYQPSEILTPRQFWRGMSEAGLVNPAHKSNRRVGGKQADFYEVMICGRATEQIREWATTEQVSSSDKAEVERSLVFSSYHAWSQKRVELSLMKPSEVLNKSAFWEAMAQSGMICYHPSGAGDEARCALEILGSKQYEKLTDAEAGQWN